MPGPGLRHGLRFGWQNSGHPVVVRAHQWSDALACARPAGIESAAAGNGLRIGYAGLAEGRLHVLPFLEQRRGGAARRHQVQTSWADLAAGRAMPDCDLLAVGCLPGRAAALPAVRSVMLPLRVNLVVGVGTDPDAIMARVSRKARQEYARENRSRSRTLDVGDTQADFSFFYDRMHAPTMVRRHGAAARTVPRAAALACIYRRGVLFFLAEGGERVAGMLCRIDRDVLVIRLAGVLDGGDTGYQHGTYMALYIGILQWAAGHGITRVDLSGGEPFLSKGTFQFKRKLHPQVVPPGNHFRGKRLWLQIRRDSGLLRDFLVANPPLIAAEDGGLTALYFHDPKREARTDLRWECPGVRAHRLVDLDAFLDGEQTLTVTAWS